MKRILIILLIICMSFSVFSGCKKTDEKEKSSSVQKDKTKNTDTEKSNAEKDDKQNTQPTDQKTDDINDEFGIDQEYQLSDEEVGIINDTVYDELNELRGRLCEERIKTEDLSKYGNVSPEFASVVCKMTYDKITFENTDLIYDGKKVSTQVIVSIPKMEFDLGYIASLLSIKEVMEFYKKSENAQGKELEELLLNYYTIALSKMPLTPETISMTLENNNGEWVITSGMSEVEKYIKGE